MKEFRHLLFMETGGHNWKKVKSKFWFTDPDDKPYIVEKCTQCGITAKRYYAIGGDKIGRGDGFIDTLYIGPQYLRKYAMECPKEMGLFDYVDPEKEETVATLGGGESTPKITRKKKKDKKDKKGKKTKGFIRIKNIKSLSKPKKVKKIKRIKRKFS